MSGRAITVYLALCLVSGCASAMLTRRTIDQAATFPGVQYGQVLDNVARFSKNPAAVPYFAIITHGTVQVTNTGSAEALVFPNFILGATGHAIWSGQYGPRVSSAVQENWNITPLTDPDKLRKMRCAYQYLVLGPSPVAASGAGSVECHDCLKEMCNFFCPDECKGHANGPVVDPQKCGECLECYLPRDWYHVGRKHEVPKNACYVGHDCDTYAWVTPEGLDGLSRFTLAIVDLATKSPPRDEVVVRRIYKGDWVQGQPPVSTEVTGRENARPPADAREAGDYRSRRAPPMSEMPSLLPQPQGILPVPSPK